MKPKTYRSLFISDLHLGTADCKADYLLDLMQSLQTEYIYLVGDVFDLWAMPQRISWTRPQSALIQAVLDKAASGTRVIYIPGNHDAPIRRFCGSEISGVSIVSQAVHETADGRRMKVTHGDEFDHLMRFNRPLKQLGDSAYGLLLVLNRAYNRLCTGMGRSYWSLSSFVKSRLGQARSYVEQYEALVAEQARDEGYDGVICGHIHQPALKKIKGIDYCNDGDWVEHCTCLVEDENGTLELLHWSNAQRVLERQPMDDQEPSRLRRVA
jgi:UDP-2,3-diacylglucosamine pyrophosphatase LpxH